MQDKIIVCGSSNSELGKLISRNFSIPLAVVEKTKFASSETRVRILSDLKSKEVYLLQSLSKPTNDHLVELLLLADAANRMNPKTITAVIPWFGYAPQDKIFRTGEALSSEVVTSLLECANFSEIVFFDVHSQTVLQKFSKKVTELSMITEFARIIKDVIGTNRSDWCVAILDKGSNQRASEFAKLLNVELVRFEKSRDLHTGKVTFHSLYGNHIVQDRNVVVFDDYISTGQTLFDSAEFLKREGAKTYTCCITHVIVPETLDKLDQSQIDCLAVSNSTNLISSSKSKKLVVIDSSPLLADIFGIPNRK